MATFDHRWRECPGWRLAARTIADLLLSAVLEHAAAHRRRHKFKGDPLMITLWQDLRFACRTLAKTPGFTLAAVLTLALGIGTNSAIYSVVDAVLLKGLPYPHASRIVFINEALPNAPGLNVAWPDYLDWRVQNQFSRGIGGIPAQSHLYSFAGRSQVRPRRLGLRFVLCPARRATRTRPRLWHSGRPARSAAGDVVSYLFWRNQLRADPGIVGRQIALANGATVAGAAWALLGPSPGRSQECSSG